MSKSKKEREKIIDWLQTKPAKNTDLPQDLQDQYERWTRADRWMHDYMSVDIVWPMLANHYGYSEATARRDIQEAQKRFGELESHPKQYYAKKMIDKVGESITEAFKDRKWREVAALSKEMRDWLGFAENAGVKDPKLLLNEVPRTILFSPALLGHERNPNILEEVRAIIEEKTGKPFTMPDFPETEYQVLPPDEDPGEQ